MDSSKIRKEIATLIDSLNEHLASISGEGHISQQEVDTLLNKIKTLYEKSIILNYLNGDPDFIIADKSIDAEVAVEKKEEDLITPERAMIESAEAEISPSLILGKEEVKTEINVSRVPDLFGGELPPVIEKQKPEKKTEKKEAPPTAHKLQRPAIADITQAIGINDKFQFAGELFSGNMQEYSIALQQLNSAGTLESAMDYFSNLQQLYGWEPENDTVKRLLDLVDRRYS